MCCVTLLSIILGFSCSDTYWILQSHSHGIGEHVSRSMVKIILYQSIYKLENTKWLQQTASTITHQLKSHCRAFSSEVCWCVESSYVNQTYSKLQFDVCTVHQWLQLDTCSIQLLCWHCTSTLMFCLKPRTGSGLPVKTMQTMYFILHHNRKYYKTKIQHILQTGAIFPHSTSLSWRTHFNLETPALLLFAMSVRQPM